MKNTLVWVSSKDIIRDFDLEKEGHQFLLFESDVNNTEFRKVAKEMKKAKVNKVLKINDNYNFELIYKINSVWSSIKFDDLITNWMVFNNLKPISGKIKLPDLLNNKKNSEIEFPWNINKDNLLNYKDVILFYIEEGAISKTLNKDDRAKSTIIEKTKIRDEKLFFEFKEMIIKTKPRGLHFNKVELIDENTIEFKTKFGEIIVKLDEDNKVLLYSILSSQKKDIAELFSFKKAMKANIISYIKNDIVELNVPKKITKKNIITWSISFVILIILGWFTFSFILNLGNVGMAFKIMFSRYSWAHEWIYFLWINFFISLFIIPIVSIIFIKAANPKEKINFKSQANIFISAQVRTVAAFITGNALLANIVWGWYLNSSRGVRVVSFVGMVVSINIIRGIIIIPVGAAFMIRGTIFNHTIFSEMGLMNQYYSFVTLSWIGWIWHTLEHLAMTLLIIIPPLHIAYNKILFMRYRNQKNSNTLIDKFTIFEMNLINLKHSFKSIFKDRKRLGRMVFTMIIVIVIETFEFTFGLRVVEDYAFKTGYINATASYWNIFAISGVRYMSGFIRNVPIIELIPGQGMGITDLALSSYTNGVINHAHGNAVLNLDQVDSLSQQTTFIMRFFNFYLKKAIALVVSLIVIPMAVIKRNKRIKGVVS